MKLKYYVELFDDEAPYNQQPNYVFITDSFHTAFYYAQRLAKKNMDKGVFIDTKINGKMGNICGIDMYGNIF